jgi:hypothetical protein
VLASRLPVFLHAVSYFDEAYLALSLAVEGHMLGAHDCLLSESLYGLKRANFDAKSWPAEQKDVAAAMPHAHMTSLTQRDRRKTLLLEAVLPYLKVCFNWFRQNTVQQLLILHIGRDIVPLSVVQFEVKVTCSE